MVKSCPQKACVGETDNKSPSKHGVSGGDVCRGGLGHAGQAGYRVIREGLTEGEGRPQQGSERGKGVSHSDT